jgi:hypothetical protein
MNSNTICEKCHFSDKATSKTSCVFGIPEAIADRKTISVINDYNIIHKYSCRYGISKDAVSTKLTDYDIDIQEYAKNRVAPSYMLYLIVDINDDFQSLCDNIMKMKILPKAVSIMFSMGYNAGSVQGICETTLGKLFNWKLHMPLGEKNEYENIKMLLSTDGRLDTVHYVLFVNSSTLQYIVDNDKINRINYILNIDQPDLGALVTNKSTNHFYGLFITVDNIKGIYLTDNRLGDVIYEKFKDALTYYD